MAIGFGTGGFGSASTDRIKFTTTIGVGTSNGWFVRAYQHGSGGGTFGRLWYGINAALTIANSIHNDDTGPSLVFSCGQWSTTVGQWTIPRPSLDAWHSHVIGYSSSATGNLPTWSVDGVAQTVTILAAAAGTVNALTASHYLGNRNDSTPDRVWDGMLADFFTVNRIPTADETAQYHAGFSSRFLRRGTSTAYQHDLVRQQSEGQNNQATVTGTVAQPHPRVIFPGRRVTAYKKVSLTPRTGTLTATLAALTLVGVGTGPITARPIYHHFRNLGVY